MGNKPQQYIHKNQKPQKSKIKTHIPVVQQEKNQEENNLETEFFIFLFNQSRIAEWKKYFEIQKIYNMEDLLSSYQMNKYTKIGKRLNEAETQILNQYLLRQQRKENVKINIKEKQDLKLFKQAESSDEFYRKIRNILIVGITGQGKSTFINTFITAIEQEFKPRENKQFELDFFEIIKIKDSQAKSDTTEVTPYKFTYQNCLFNLIDTPGLADTQGPLKDQKRITQISKYIREELYDKNQKLHAVLFVSQSSTQYEVIESNPSLLQLSILSILKLFGKQMCEFTKHCLTFSDFSAISTQNFESQDSVFYSLRQNQIVNQEFYYQFQNSVFRAEKQGFIEKIHFIKTFLNYRNLFQFISDPNNKGFSLEETTNVIKQRKTIYQELEGLQGKIQKFFKILKQIDENTRKQQIYNNKEEVTKGYQTKIYLTEWEKKPSLKNGRQAYSINCSECSQTCCRACQSQKVKDCVQMIDKAVNNKYIKYCECGHSIEHHSQQDFYFKPKQVLLIEINKELKNEHFSAQKNKISIDSLLRKKEAKRHKIKQKILKVLIIMKDCLTQLLSSALYKLDILDVKAIDFVLKFYPEYKNVLQEFQDIEIQQLGDVEQ
ncbi:unnamed protein product [Paramecium sonneborni]|uniref:Tr-type G domain-containing protein n=2 Tax=Paramecium sonneborni TaxID=65129 RepID=A0A8S1PIJ9_9CILI|nr:unnamed protein product [Paramecium sonneborni]